MNATVPKPNKAIYPRMYTPSGRLLHRSWGGHPAHSPLCARFPWWHPRAVEGVTATPPESAAAGPDLLDFDPEHAAKLKVCQTCHDRAGRFA